MSNKPKGVKIHPANKLSNTELAYNAFIRGMVKLSICSHFLGKHVGSKPIKVLKQRLHKYMR